MKRLLLIGCAGVAAVACGVGSSPTAPIPTSARTFVDVAAGTPSVPSAPCPTPTPPAVAIFGHRSVPEGCGGGSNLFAAFKIRPNPPSGPAALPVEINMCQSFDTDPTIDIHYHADFGDGSSDQGFCRLGHTYPNPGQFTATACVWDRIPAHAPGTCQNFLITVGTTCQAFLSNPQVNGSCIASVDARTVGTAGCGTPLRVDLFQPKFNRRATAVGNCPPGGTCTLTFAPNVDGGTLAILTPSNATGNSLSFIVPSCG
jgi:hypothetical protein